MRPGSDGESTHLVSGRTIPSSTQAIVVFLAPISMTQADESPAPKVAPRDSWANKGRREGELRFASSSRVAAEIVSSTRRIQSRGCRKDGFYASEPDGEYDRTHLLNTALLEAQLPVLSQQHLRHLLNVSLRRVIGDNQDRRVRLRW